ncbi:MAG: PAS domain S-box protein, partial [FCB group bacterium]|nr:PAS domain S-box protein [FCB group bacterium]
MGIQVDELLPGGIELLGMHDYACLVYDSNEDPGLVMARYLQVGLDRGEFCVYMASADADSAAASLILHGLEVEQALASGRLLIGTVSDSPAPEAIKAWLEERMREASQRGASALRVLVEPDLSGKAGADPEHLLRCEAVSTAFYASTHSVGLSVYRRDRVSARLLPDVIRSHPTLVVAGSVVRNFYHVPADELLGPRRHDREVDRLLSNLHERQSLEYRLRDQIRQTQFMLESSLDGYFRVTLDGTFLDVNDAFASMVAYPRQALPGMTLKDLQPDVPPERIRARLEEIVRDGSSRFERHFRRRDGEYCELSISASLVHAAGKTHIVAFCRDITEHKAVTTALHESERRYRQILENAQLLACTVDAEGRVTFCNEYFETLTGWRREELLGRNWFECLVPEEDRACSYGAFLRIGAEHEDLPVQAEREILTRSGERRTVVWTTCTLRGTHGEVAGVATIGVDITERKQAEAALRESEERFRELAELLPEIVYEMDVEGRITFANKRAFEVLKYTKEDLSLGVPATSLVLDGQRDNAERRLREVLAGAQFNNHEYTLCAKDGRRVPVMARTSLIHRNGKPAGARGILFDITERKKAEEAIHRNEARTRAILKAIPDLIFLNDKRGVFLEFHSGESHPVLPPTEYLGCRMRDVLPAELAPLCDAFDRTAATGRPEKIEYPLTFGGKPRYFEARIVPCHEDTVLTVIREITDRRQAEEALVRARDFHLTLLEEFPSLVWRADAEGNWDYFNRTWLAFTGRTIEEEKGEGWIESVHPEDCDRCLRIHRAAFDARAPFELEYRLRRRDGEYRWVTDLGRPFDDLNGHFAGYVGSCYDITDRKNAEAERRKLEGKIKHTQKLESLGVLAGGIAHDFNNLLTGILGHADLALLDLLPDSPAYDSLRHIETAARRAAELTKQLLAYTGKGRFVVTSDNQSTLIQEMVHLLEVSISKKCIVEYECAP